MDLQESIGAYFRSLEDGGKSFLRNHLNPSMGNIVEFLDCETRKNYETRARGLVEDGQYFAALDLVKSGGYSLEELSIVVPAKCREEIVLDLRNSILGNVVDSDEKAYSIRNACRLFPELNWADMNLMDGFVGYDVRGNLRKAIETGDVNGLFGKCTLFYDPKNSGIGLDILRHPIFRLERPDLGKVKNMNWDGIGIHKNLIPGDCFGIGGGYFCMETNKFIVGGYSQDLGGFSQHMIKRCLPEGFEIEAKDSLSNNDVCYQLLNEIFRHENVNCPSFFERLDNGEERIEEASGIPEDEIPF